ncbi:hypothetical protein WJM97_15455 [Okeanomitos corallinicola TIOX110]|uniref:Uncharacterized protein n=1 Tax=Okeanomitos corallinicola TIOX110 TaxID=3133117 RepID=A0ABZ2UP66_9CYAN
MSNNTVSHNSPPIPATTKAWNFPAFSKLMAYQQQVDLCLTGFSEP